MPAVTVRGVTLGQGRPKIIAPLTAATAEELTVEAREVAAAGPDIVEWRADHLTGLTAPGEALAVAEALVPVLGGRPLLVTVRSTREGGRGDLDDATFTDLLLTLTQQGLADLVDVELARPPAVTREIVDGAHRHGAAVVLSHHDFAVTPPQQRIVDLLRQMHARGADVAKVAVTPRSPQDVLALLAATWEVTSAAPGDPVITMSMGELGGISRLGGGVFGSAATFASAGRPSAPGQLPIAPLRDALALLHA